MLQRLSNPAYNDESTSWKQPVDVLPDNAMMRDDTGSASEQGDF